MSVIERTVSRPKHEKPSASAAGDVIVVEQLRMRYAATKRSPASTFAVTPTA